MMILPDHKLAFIHIYKTGGTSLTHILAPHTSNWYRNNEPRMDGPGWQGTWHFRGNQHAKFSSKVAGFPKEIADELPDYQFLTVVRDPYTWSFSVYREFFSRDQGGEKGSNFLFGQVYPDRRLEDFHAFVPTFMPGYSNDIGLGTQASFVDGIPPEQLTLIRFENYENDLRRVMLDFGIPVDDIPHELDRGDTKRKRSGDVLHDPAHVAFCNQVYAEDFARFGYPMQTPQPHQQAGE